MKIETKVDKKWVSKPRAVKKPKLSYMYNPHYVKFYIAIVNGDLQLVKALLKKGYKIKKLWCMSRMLHRLSFEMMNLLFENGLDPNKMEYVDGETMPLLHYCDDLEIVKLVVEKYGADVNIMWEGHTPLYVHDQYYYTSIIPIYNYLVSKGAVSK